MAASTTRRITQPNSHHSARSTAPALRPSFKSNIAHSMLPLAPLHPRKHCRETSFAAKIRNAGRYRPTACAVLPAQRRRTQPCASKWPPASAKRTSRRATATTCAALPAQALPRDFIRGQNPKSRSVPDRTARAVLPATNCFTRQLSLSARARRGVKLIYGSAIKTSHKGRRISKLRNSNRR